MALELINICAKTFDEGVSNWITNMNRSQNVSADLIRQDIRRTKILVFNVCSVGLILSVALAPLRMVSLQSALWVVGFSLVGRMVAERSFAYCSVQGGADHFTTLFHSLSNALLGPQAGLSFNGWTIFLQPEE